METLCQTNLKKSSVRLKIVTANIFKAAWRWTLVTFMNVKHKNETENMIYVRFS